MHDHEDTARLTAGTGRSVAMRPWVWAGVAAVAAILLPFAVAAVPPLNDYPFRLARVRILQQLDAPAFFAQYYEPRSFLIPNVAMDVVVWALATVMPLEAAARVFLALVQGLTLGGCVWLHRVVTGRRAYWPLVAALFLHNWILLFGFLNFQLGVALILWALGAWLRVRERAVATRLVVGATAAVALFFCHMMALGLYAILVAAIELGAAVERRRTPGRAFLDLVVGAVPFLPAAYLFSRSPTYAGGNQGGVVYEPHWWWKPFAFARHFMSGNLYLDAVTVAAGIALVALVVTGARVRLAPRMGPALAATAVTFLVMPFGLYSAVHLDIRVPMVLWFLGVAALDVEFRTGRRARMFAFGVALLLVVRSVVIAADWRAFNRTYDDVLATFTGMAPGSAMVVATAAPPAIALGEWMDHWRPQLTHIASMASVRQPIFVVPVWAHPAQQPFAIRPRYQALYDFQNNNPKLVTSAAELAHMAERSVALQAAAHSAGAPPQRLYLLLLYPARLAGTLPPWRRLGAGDKYALFEIAAH